MALHVFVQENAAQCTSSVAVGRRGRGPPSNESDNQ